jgi:hypothetical protein
MKRVCLLNGSLRGEKASSLQFLNRISARMDAGDFHVDRFTVRAGVTGSFPHEALAVAADADVIVMAFPLFSYTLSGALTKFLEDFSFHVQEGQHYVKHAKIFAIINCGFPEPWIIEEAIRVIRNFCGRLGLCYRFSIAIGGGPVTVMTMKVPFFNLRLKEAFASLVKDAGCGETARREDIFIKPIIPKPILIKIKEHYEKKSPTLFSPTARDTQTC